MRWHLGCWVTAWSGLLQLTQYKIVDCLHNVNYFIVLGPNSSSVRWGCGIEVVRGQLWVPKKSFKSACKETANADGKLAPGEPHAQLYKTLLHSVVKTKCQHFPSPPEVSKLWIVLQWGRNLNALDGSYEKQAWPCLLLHFRSVNPPDFNVPSFVNTRGLSFYLHLYFWYLTLPFCLHFLLPRLSEIV